MDDSRPAEHLRRILVIDDTASIHRDFDKVLAPQSTSDTERALEALDELLFSEEAEGLLSAHAVSFELEHAYQGEEGLAKVAASRVADRPFSVAFVDMRMPPGWDGLRTVDEISKADPDLQIVICSAYSDYSWSQIMDRLGRTDRLLILKKPFDQAEVYQLATALSEKWIAERSTRELLADLESKVKLRTEELTNLNEHLKVVAEDAQSSERAKGRFLATMSHEIRTTLNGIIGASSMLNMSKSLSPADQELANIIQTSGDALMVVINDILDYSKYESGQLELESIPFALAQLAEECGILLEPAIQSSHIEFSLLVDDRLPSSLLGDPARIRQVILNLLNNAIKFSENGRVTLSLMVEDLDASTATLRIEVRDNGIGMNQETKERLFSAFMQADSSTTRRFGGTGLGLAICKLLSDAMKATIEVDSAPGEGSTFRLLVTLPVSDQEPVNAKSDAHRRTAERDAARSAPDFAGRRVLLVDDNAINRKLGIRFLSRMNIEVETAENGVEAIEAFLERPFDLILMDLQMPEMDGFQATKKIRSYERDHAHEREPVPIIALTANAFAEIREECEESGMSDFLTKPMRIDELKTKLNLWLDVQRRV